MVYTTNELKEFSENFIQELVNAEMGVKSSLSFIKSPIPKTNLVKPGESFQVITVGGSFLESAMVKVAENQIELSDYKRQALPKLDSKDIFLQIITGVINTQSSVLGLNFAFAVEPIIRENKLDAVLKSTSKEHRFQGLVGQKVGLEIEKYLWNNRQQKIDVAVINDTFALGLATRELKDFNWKNTLVGIVGTGTNFGFFADQNTFINLESGNFNKFNQSKSVKIIDLESFNPGQQIFEKEVAGAYLAQHFNIEAKLAGYKTKLNGTEGLGNILKKPKDPTLAIAQDIFNHSSQLIAMEIYSLWKYKTLSGHVQKDQKIMLLMEGSLYWKGFEYAKKVDFYLNELGLSKDNYEIRYLEHMGLKGAARLAYLG